MRIEEHEWQTCREQLTAGFERKAPTMSTATTPKLKTSAMIASFADPGQKTSSAPFGHALVKAAQENDKIVGLTADLGKYTDMHIFAQAFPERFFQMGMAEQLLFGAAAGLAETGLVPFASTYSVFAARRAYDFLCLDAAEPNLNVNIVGGLPGLTTGYGPSHQATEDMAIFRGMPNLTIVDPCDSIDIEQAVPQLAASDGPTYLRLLRGNVPTVLDEYDYTLRTRQGQGPARRQRRRLRLQRADDHAGAAGRRAAGGTQRGRRRRPRPHDQAVRRRDGPRRAEHRPPRGHAGEPHRGGRPVRDCRLGRRHAPDWASGWCRWRCRTSSSTPAPCPPCTRGTGCPCSGSSPRCSPNSAEDRARDRQLPVPRRCAVPSLLTHQM